jgi:hypothetical protein
MQAGGITNVLAEPDYVEAYISWDTTEPTDALVQFGESALLNRTAYAADFSDSHLLTVPGLVPDRKYYYQVVSRDLAGNTTVDDNGGKLYTFTTLRPFFAPWQDALETGAPGWSTYSESVMGEGGTALVEWQLGVPSSELGPAHSQSHAWGVNLAGVSIDMADTFLISPPIYLGGGNKATLTFWHNYDFPVVTDSEIELG